MRPLLDFTRRKARSLALVTLGLLTPGLVGGGPSRHHLIVCLDGVGYQEFSELQRSGHFSYLRPASKLIAPFPSLTNPAMVEVLEPRKAPLAAGYEDRYFDRRNNRLRGSVLNRLGPEFVEGSFRKVFDYHPPGFLSSFEYVVPPFSCLLFGSLDIRAGVHALRDPAPGGSLSYIGATDCAAHSGGRWAVRQLLKGLDSRLSQLLTSQPDLEVTLFSDHGNEYARYHRAPIGRALREKGFRIRHKLETERDVVLPRFGLIGAVFAHVQPGLEAEVADGISRVEGVRFAGHAQQNEVVLWRRGSQSRIRRQGQYLAYIPGVEDPLLLGPAVTSRTPQDWFETTADHVLPDPVNRVWEHSSEFVENQADVWIDLEPGFYFGSRVMDLFVALKATHGGLSRHQSLGFVSSSFLELPRILRNRELGGYLEKPRLRPPAATLAELGH